MSFDYQSNIDVFFFDSIGLWEYVRILLYAVMFLSICLLSTVNVLWNLELFKNFGDYFCNASPKALLPNEISCAVCYLKCKHYMLANVLHAILSPCDITLPVSIFWNISLLVTFIKCFSYIFSFISLLHLVVQVLFTYGDWIILAFILFYLANIFYCVLWNILFKWNAKSSNR